MTTLGIISDLHLDFRNITSFSRIPLPESSLLSICGDISNSDFDLYYPFLEYCGNKYQHVFLITGNHDYYGSSRPLIDNCLEKWTKDLNNVHFLQRQTFILGRFSFIGATLWSDISVNYLDDVKNGLNDYRNIYYQYKTNNDIKTRFVNPTDIISWHKKDIAWIKYQIFKNQQNNLLSLIFTHHSPIYQENLKHIDGMDFLNSSYNNRLDYLFVDNVRLWGFGHTHHAYRQKIGNTLLVNNPWGYPGELKNFNDCIINLNDLY